MARYIYGTSYNDTIYQNSYSDVAIYSYGGNDKIYLNLVGAYGGGNYVDAGTGNDYVKNWFEGGNEIDLYDGNDTYIAFGFSKVSYDVVYAGYGNDKIDVSTYGSKYYGEQGDDQFFSVGFRNYFNGGSGRDVISYATQDTDPDLRGHGVEIDLGAGYAQTYGNTVRETLVSIEDAVGTGAADDIYGSSGANSLWGGKGSDLVDGMAGNDKVYGGDGNDFLYGNSGHDDLYGDAGNDKLWGGSGDDDLWGGVGNDTLNGGAGSDYLYGGTGADYFVFTSIADSRGSARDTIFDFNRASGDYIDLRSIDADTTGSGNQAFEFIRGAAFSGTAGELRYSGGVLSGDVNGDGVSDFQINVKNVSALYSSDILL
ncbi:calcium-binding protein [Allorhizobium borbori]|uniref:Serralysin n=1 Tax=Allorhizobium borbori TaxID=485907 RepID=A0A7W6K412_9HYPH|nr:calcium-binding protein [Allorhizobium borbori]MBB4104823.1 serralysin [Allorhizobium borbori]